MGIVWAIPDFLLRVTAGHDMHDATRSVALTLAVAVSWLAFLGEFFRDHTHAWTPIRRRLAAYSSTWPCGFMESVNPPDETEDTLL